MVQQASQGISDCGCTLITFGRYRYISVYGWLLVTMLRCYDAFRFGDIDDPGRLETKVTTILSFGSRAGYMSFPI